MSLDQDRGRAQARLGRAAAQAEATAERVGAPRDPGALSGTRRSSTPRQARREAAAMDRSVDAAVEYVAAQKQVEHLDRKARIQDRHQAIRDAATFQCPIAELRPGDAIRYEQRGNPTYVGRVKRVNAKTVTLCAEAGMDEPKIAHEKIIATVVTQQESS